MNKQKSSIGSIRTYSIVLFLLVWAFQVNTVEAVVLNASTYTLDAEGSVPIVVAAPATDGLLVLYDTNSPTLPVLFWDNYAEGDDLNYSRLPPGQYALVELSPSVGDAWVCTTPEQELAYTDCKSLSGFVNEFLFIIVKGSYDSGSPVWEPPTVFGKTSYDPEIQIVSPRGRTLFAKEISIEYRATDENDGDGNTQDTMGLGKLPVSLFYSSTFSGRDNVTMTGTEGTLIAKGLPAIGTYIWKGIDLIEGVFYKIIAQVVDIAGEIGQTVSDYFQVDITSPTFIVTTDPAVAKNEIVRITVRASEALSGVPEVTVRQRGAPEFTVKMSDSGDSQYEGVYTTVVGFDGMATIEVLGRDMAGNSGTLIVGGGNFSVGINPPGKPTITSPLHNQQVDTDSISIEGVTREDTDIRVTVNGIETYSALPDESGAFSVKNVRLKKNIKNGQNIINIVARDRAGAISEAVVLAISYNIAPRIAITSPQQGDLLTGTMTTTTSAVDSNGDALRFRYEIIPEALDATVALNWQTVADVPTTTAYIDTTALPDGKYILRVLADDGASVVTSDSVHIRIANESSFFIRFYDGLRTVVGQKNVSIRGMVYAQKNISPQPIVRSIEYSLDGGARWFSVKAQDGSFDTNEERFEVVLKDIPEGNSAIIWKTTDSRGVSITTERPITVDLAVPKAPVLIFPKKDTVISREQTKKNAKGIPTITLRGTAEPGTTVHTQIGDSKVVSKVAFDGTFSSTEIPLPRRGTYTLQSTTVDDAGNKSSPISYSFLYNNLPQAVFTNPANGRGITGTTKISWLTSDIDNDTVTTKSISYRQIGKSFVDIAKNIQGTSYTWNTASIAEGSAYELRLTVDDGLSTSVIQTPFSVDRTPPVVDSFTFLKEVYATKGLFDATGKVSDTGSGVLFVEYRFVPEDATDTVLSPWYKARLKKSAGKTLTFSVQNPENLPDSAYRVVVRAIDIAGNISAQSSQMITIDSTAPRIGSFSLEHDGNAVVPQNDVWSVSMDTTYAMTLSLEKDALSAVVYAGSTPIPFTKETATGLWKGDITIEDTETALTAVVKDIYGNTSEVHHLAVLRLDQKSVPAKESAISRWWNSIVRMILSI